MLMVSRFMNCLGFSHFPRNVFFFWSFLELFNVFFFFLCCQDLVDIFSHILLYLLIKFCGSCCTYLLFHQRCSSTSLSNSTECFYVPWSWTDYLPSRNKRHRKQSQQPLLLSIDAISSLHPKYLVERSTFRIILKLFLFTGCLYYNSNSDPVFLDGCFLLDADRGNLSLLLRYKSLQH